MNELLQQVRAAQRRLFWQRFVGIVPVTTSCGLAVALLAILAPKLWPLPVLNPLWSQVWLAGALVLGLVTAGCWTWMTRRPQLIAALEIDRRFGLRERVSSLLALTADERATPAGEALLHDASRRVAQLDVRHEFGIRASRWTLVPLLVGIAASVLTLLSDVPLHRQPQAQAATTSTQQRIQNSTNELKKKLEQQRQQALARGLEEAGDTLKKLEQGLDALNKRETTDPQKAFVKLNDLARDLQQRQKELGRSDDLRKQLDALKDIQQGPAERMARAMKQGDFQLAQNELRELQKKLSQDQLTAEEKDKLQQQLETMQKKLDQLAASHRQAKEELSRQIEEKVQQGDREGASKLQKKLDQLTQQEKLVRRSKEMAQKLGNCKNSLKQGKGKEAASQLGDMASDLEAMQQEMQEMEMLEESLDQIAQAKDSMGCQKCNGKGCSHCMGSGMSDSSQGSKQIDGRGPKGEGQGQGERPEEETQTNFYESQVRTKPGKGNSVVDGPAAGPNRSGDALEEVKSVIAAGKSSDEDPLTGQRLPKRQRELTREYFDAFREGRQGGLNE